ncbi:MAG: phosphodiesterase [Mycobacterium sp.]|nr:phosphodiesterase [Mycobacterium sp.]
MRPFTSHFQGHPGFVHFSDIAAYPFRLGAALRHRRVFHPDGVIARGTIERTAPATVGLPVQSGPVTARLSKGAGTPGALPDFAGLAWRMSSGPSSTTPWDVLMVSAGSTVLGRITLWPTTSWQRATFSTLMPLGYRGTAWWLRARLTSTTPGAELTLDALAAALREGTPLRIEVDQAAGLKQFEPLAMLTLETLVPVGEQDNLALDPTRHSAPGVTLLPGWLTTLRRAAYRGSRQGRHDADVNS